MCHPLWKGTKSNWTIDSKAISCAGVGNSFVPSLSIKHIKGLELIWGVVFAFGRFCCEDNLRSKEISRLVKQAILKAAKTEKTHPRNCYNIRSGKIYSLVLRKKESTGELSNAKRPGPHDAKHTTSYVQHGGGSVMARACMAASGTESLVFTDDVTQDRSSRMNSVVSRDILSAQTQSNWLAAFHNTDGQWPETYSQSNPGVY